MKLINSYRIGNGYNCDLVKYKVGDGKCKFHNHWTVYKDGKDILRLFCYGRGFNKLEDVCYLISKYNKFVNCKEVRTNGYVELGEDWMPIESNEEKIIWVMDYRDSFGWKEQEDRLDNIAYQEIPV